ncbi:MAG: hypothetical protein QM817_31220 [Archangium sp.]
MRARTQLTDAANAARRLQGNPVVNARNTTSTFGRAMRPLRIGGSVFGMANNVRRLPGQMATAFTDIRRAFRTGSAADRIQAERSSRTALSTYSTIGDTAAAFRRNARAATYGVTRTIQQRAPQLAARVGETATRLAESSAARIATRVISNPAVRATASVAGRSLARFVPAANVAIAALDIREARRALADPNASTGRRVTSVITAIGSTVAASNIPVVSQIGAAVSTISSAIGWLFS